jgi:rod shape-determining protein MreB and related proteins
MNLRSLIGIFSGGPCYARIDRTSISIRDVSTGATFESAAKLGLDSANRIVSVGDISSPNVVRIVEPFEHPRIVMSDFACASKLIQYGLHQLTRVKWITPSPILVLQPLMELTGGLSEIENRAPLELGESAGARKTVIHCGKTLSDQEVIALSQGGGR